MTAPLATVVPSSPGQARRVPPGSSVPSVWTNSPTLGNVPGQQYLGRVVVEVFDSGGHASVPAARSPLIGRAIAALESQSAFPATPASWPVSPIMGSDPSFGAYRGRVVAEIWDAAVNVAITAASGSVAHLIQAAARDLARFGS
jgi:hypothetical protein